MSNLGANRPTLYENMRAVRIELLDPAARICAQRDLRPLGEVERQRSCVPRGEPLADFSVLTGYGERRRHRRAQPDVENDRSGRRHRHRGANPSLRPGPVRLDMLRLEQPITTALQID